MLRRTVLEKPFAIEKPKRRQPLSRGGHSALRLYGEQRPQMGKAKASKTGGERSMKAEKGEQGEWFLKRLGAKGGSYHPRMAVRCISANEPTYVATKIVETRNLHRRDSILSAALDASKPHNCRLPVTITFIYQPTIITESNETLPIVPPCLLRNRWCVDITFSSSSKPRRRGRIS